MRNQKYNERQADTPQTDTLAAREIHKSTFLFVLLCCRLLFLVRSAYDDGILVLAARMRCPPTLLWLPFSLLSFVCFHTVDMRLMCAVILIYCLFSCVAALPTQIAFSFCCLVWYQCNRHRAVEALERGAATPGGVPYERARHHPRPARGGRSRRRHAWLVYCSHAHPLHMYLQYFTYITYSISLLQYLGVWLASFLPCTQVTTAEFLGGSADSTTSTPPPPEKNHGRQTEKKRKPECHGAAKHRSIIPKSTAQTEDDARLSGFFCGPELEGMEVGGRRLPLIVGSRYSVG